MFNYLLKSLFNQAIFYLCLLFFGLDSRMTPVSFYFVGYVTMIYLLSVLQGENVHHLLEVLVGGQMKAIQNVVKEDGLVVNLVIKTVHRDVLKVCFIIIHLFLFYTK